MQGNAFLKQKSRKIVEQGENSGNSKDGDPVMQLFSESYTDLISSSTSDRAY